MTMSDDVWVSVGECVRVGDSACVSRRVCAGVCAGVCVAVGI